MNRIANLVFERVGWVFGLSTLIGLLASTGYLLIE